jgi:hypothetical protein
MKKLRKIYPQQLGHTLPHFFLFTLILFICSCSSSKKLSYAKAVKLGTPALVIPGIMHTGGAQACESCLAGNYYHPYKIEAGINAGNVYLCCVPIEELARESFDCSCQLLPYLGTSLDQKVQTCLLIDPVSTVPHQIRVCIQAPISVSDSINLTNDLKKLF